MSSACGSKPAGPGEWQRESVCVWGGERQIQRIYETRHKLVMQNCPHKAWVWAQHEREDLRTLFSRCFWFQMSGLANGLRAPEPGAESHYGSNATAVKALECSSGDISHYSCWGADGSNYTPSGDQRSCKGEFRAERFTICNHKSQATSKAGKL